MKKPFVWGCLLAAASLIKGQPPVPNRPFTLTGVIEEFTLNAKKPTASASIRVHGITASIPENLIVQMPGTYLTPADLFRVPVVSGSVVDLKKDTGSAADFRDFSCLSLQDINDAAKGCKITGSIEATVIGNVVNGEYIAGMVWITHGAFATGSGKVVGVTSNPPQMTIQPATGSLVTVRINDPEGRFAMKHSDDVRFKSDNENPTIHAQTGYPMCIPRSASDALCPAGNRHPTSKTMFTAGSPAQSSIYPACNGCDPKAAAPIVDGDEIIYSGTLMKEGTKTFISAHTIEVNAAIYTPPCSVNCGAVPVYTFIETSRWGTGGVPFPNLGQETGPGRKLPPPATTTHVKVEGMTTDPTRPVRVFAVDVDPATGAETLRLLAVIPAAPTPFGRFRLALPPANHLPATREIKVAPLGIDAVAGIPVTVGSTNLTIGVYQAPVAEHIFPEGNVPGQVPVPMNFESLCFLQDGSGPLKTRPWAGSATPPVVGQLKPFPASGQKDKDLDAFGNQICRLAIP